MGAQGRPRACFLGSAQVNPGTEAAALAGQFSLVYLTPEKLTGGFLSKLKAAATPLLLVAIDEAHCISEWGHDFRPAYRGLQGLRDGLDLQVPVMALTATASARVQEDIQQSLGLLSPLLARSSFDRPNLQLRVARKTSRAQDLARVAELALAGSTIVPPRRVSLCCSLLQFQKMAQNMGESWGLEFAPGTL